MLQKQNKVEAPKVKKEISPVVSQPPPPPAFDRLEVPSEVVARAAASVSKNPAVIRALAQINEALKLCQDLRHKSLAKGGATSRFLRSPKKEKDPMKNPRKKKVKLEQ